MDNILIVAHHLIPYTPSYGQIARHLTLINELTKNYRVHVVTVKGVKNYGNFGFQFSNDVIIHNVEDPYFLPDENPIIFEGRNKLEKLFFSFKNYGLKVVLQAFIRLFRRKFLLDNYEYPGVSTFYKKICYLINEILFSKIIIMTPPYSFHKLSFMIKKKYKKLPMLIDVQDSFVVPALLKGYSLYNIRSRRMERKSMMNADKIIFNIPIMKKRYDNYYNISHKTELLLNGYDSNHQLSSNINKINLSDRKLNIGYFGKIHIGNDNYFRDIRKLFNFFKRMDNKFKEKIQLDIYGYFSGNYKEWESIVPFTYHGQIDSNKVFGQMKQYDVLLLFHSEKSRAEEVLTGKLFEYVFAKKPIISLGPKNMIAAKEFVELNKLGIFIDIDFEDEIEKKIEYLYRLKMENNFDKIFNKNFNVSSYDRKLINKKYVNIIKNL